MRKLWACLALLALAAMSACAEPGFYQPAELADNDFDDPASRWCWARSAQSAHFFLFWETGFGADPAGADVPEPMRVEPDALLAAAERCWQLNAERLGFLSEPSGLDDYKMEIYLFCQDEWLATGSGYDDVIGALWVNPGACAPVGATFAHEIGHCFQYQVGCDAARADGEGGFRYAPGGGMGNGFWEQCAQWQSYQAFPEEAFTEWDVALWQRNSHRAFEHEWTRYQSYWMPYEWARRWGADALGRLWRESRDGEDALAALQRVFLDDDPEALKAMLYDYAARCATFDYDGLREDAAPWIGSYRTEYYDAGDGTLQVGYASCPADSGFTVTELALPAPGSAVGVGFEGLAPGAPLAPGDPGLWHTGADGDAVGGRVSCYNPLPGNVEPGWRYGFVALLEDGRRAYSPMFAEPEGTARFAPPAGTRRLFFVVAGAASRHCVNPWDEDERTDVQLPYRVALENTAWLRPADME